MYVVSLNPEENEMIYNDTLLFCKREDQVQSRVVTLASKYPNMNVLVYRLERNIITEYKVETKTYRYNDKGELTPE